MLEQYPVYREELDDEEEYLAFEKVKEVIGKIRNIRAEMSVPVAKRVHLFLLTDDKKAFEDAAMYIEKLAGVSGIAFVNDKKEAGEKLCQAVATGAEIFIPLGELVDAEKETARLNKEKEKVLAEIKRSEGMLNNQGFVAKAPAALIEKEKEKLASNKALLEKIENQLKDLL